MKLKMKQIIIAEWQGADGLTYSTIGLGEDGAVYRYDVGYNGWIRYKMELAEYGLKGHKR